MRDVSRRCASALGVAAVLVAASTVMSAARDVKSFPAGLRSFASPSGNHVLEIAGDGAWSTSAAHATLFGTGDGERAPIWSRLIAHRYGPRFALVDDGGRVVLLDEWIRTPTPLAVVVLDASGSEITRHATQDIAAVMSFVPATMARSARIGPWMASPPALSSDQRRVTAAVGDALLGIDVRTGALQRVEGDGR